MSDCPCPKHPFGCYGHPTSCGCEHEGAMRLVFTIDGDDISPERLEEYKKALNALIGYDGKWEVESGPPVQEQPK